MYPLREWRPTNNLSKNKHKQPKTGAESQRLSGFALPFLSGFGRGTSSVVVSWAMSRLLKYLKPLNGEAEWR